MKTLLKNMTIGFILIAGTWAMEETMVMEGENLILQEQKTRELTATEKKNAQKMMMINEAFQRHEDRLTKEGEEVKDISKNIGGKLHELSANPVLEGELVYTDKGNTKSFKIRDLLKEDGGIDLSNKEVFGDASKNLLITIDPEQFFKIVENSVRLVILIAPKFLIEEKIETSAKPFESIMANWLGESASIAIFYRTESWSSFLYDYLITVNIFTISKNSLYENWLFWHSCTYDYAYSHAPLTAFAQNFMFTLNKLVKITGA